MLVRLFANIKKRIFGILGIIAIFILPLLHTLYRYFKFKHMSTIDYNLIGLMFFAGILIGLFLWINKVVDKIPRSAGGYLLRMTRTIIPMIIMFMIFKYIEDFFISASSFMLVIIGYVSVGYMLLALDFRINKAKLIYKERLKKAKELKDIQDIMKQLEVK